MRILICTPVGPGHEAIVDEAIKSVKAAARPDGVHVAYAPLHDTDEAGRSATRNLLRRDAAPADWVFWLDADDLMAPDAFLGLQAALKADPHLDAVWGTISCFKGQEPPRVRPAQEYPTDYADLIRMEPTRTLQSGFFVRAAIAQREPWNEDMDAGEDFEMYLRLWKQYRCAKVQTVFMHNRRGMHSNGPRSATGGEWRREVTRLLMKARNGR